MSNTDNPPYRFKGADNPSVNFKAVTCPSEITSKSGCARR